MKLDHGTISRDAAADALHLLLQNVEVGRRDALVLLNDDVASAKEAETFTEGNVHVKRNRRPGTLGFFVDALEIGGTERIVPDRRRRIACIARGGAVVFFEGILPDTELAPPLIQAW